MTSLARALARALDPVILARDAGLAPDDWQASALRSRHPRQLWNVCRQAGKSSTGAVMAVHETLFRPGSLVLLVSPSARQSGELIRKVLEMYRALDRPTGADAETMMRLELQNGSRVVALPGNEVSIRGFSAPRLVLLDEASRIPDELMAGISPMLATVPDARLVAMSTPAGKRGWWWRAWSDGGQLWERIEVPATAVPRISPAFLESERATMTQAQYRQEYGCSFEQTDASVFDPQDVGAAIRDDVDPLALPSLAAWRSA